MKINNKKLLLAASAILLVLVASIVWYTVVRDDKNDQTEKPDTTKSADTINLDPPTEEEQSAGDQQKEEIIQNQDQPETNPQTSQKKASVIITDAGQYDDVIEVRSFIPDHYEDGICSIKFTQGTKSFSKNAPAYRDASTTICTNPLIKRSEFSSSGDWQVSVSYKASGANGISKTKTIRIN